MLHHLGLPTTMDPIMAPTYDDLSCKCTSINASTLISLFMSVPTFTHISVCMYMCMVMCVCVCVCLCVCVCVSVSV